MNNLNTNPLYSMKLTPDKSMEFNHSDKEFEEVLEDGLRLNDMVKQLQRQVEAEEKSNLALIRMNEELEAENSKLKSMLAKAQADFLGKKPAPEQDMVDKPLHYRQHAMECFDEMVAVFGVEAAKSYCKCAAWKYRYRAPYKGKFEEDNAKADWYLKKLSELNAATTSENEPGDI